MYSRILSLVFFAAAFLVAQRVPFPSHAPGTLAGRVHQLIAQAERPRLSSAPLSREKRDALSVAALLAAVTSDPDPRVREHAATALGSLGDGRACLPLTEVLLEDPNARVREHAAEALGALGDERARDAVLLAMLRDVEPRVRRHAAEALGMVGG